MILNGQEKLFRIYATTMRKNISDGKPIRFTIFLCNLIKESELIINRNEVDAEKQLRMGISAV